MSLLAKDKITEVFCIADDFCKEYSKVIEENRKLPQLSAPGAKKHRNRPHQMSDSEIITVPILFHSGSFRNFKHFYLFHIGELLHSECPKQLSYNRFVETAHTVFVPLMLFLNMACFGKCTGITFVDSTKTSVCNNKRIFKHKAFGGFAQRGKSTMGWFHGFKLHSACNGKGGIIAFCLAPGNTGGRNIDAFNMLENKLSGKLYGDRGYIPASLFGMLFRNGAHLVAGIKNNMKNRLVPLYDRIMLRKRPIIETINDELKNICMIEHSRHRSVRNFTMNLIAATGAYCLFDKNG